MVPFPVFYSHQFTDGELQSCGKFADNDGGGLKKEISGIISLGLKKERRKQRKDGKEVLRAWQEKAIPISAMSW